MERENKFSERLKQLRKEKGLTQTELSIKLENKIAQSSIALWEANKRTPNMEALIIFAQFFEVSIDYLVGLVDLK